MPEQRIGVVSHYFAEPVTAGIEVLGSIKIGDTLHIKGGTTDVTFALESIHVSGNSAEEARGGQAVVIKVPDRVRANDDILKVTE